MVDLCCFIDGYGYHQVLLLTFLMVHLAVYRSLANVGPLMVSCLYQHCVVEHAKHRAVTNTIPPHLAEDRLCYRGSGAEPHLDHAHMFFGSTGGWHLRVHPTPPIPCE